MMIRSIKNADIEPWIDMRLMLWPDSEREDLMDEVASWASGATGVFVADTGDGFVGFVEVSMHEDAPGCTTSPVGYLEGWWVDSDHQRSGTGGRLLEAAEEWAREHGAAEFASDAHEENLIARAVHAASGFTERKPVVRFHKRIVDDEPKAGVIDDSDPVTLREIDNDNVRSVLDLDVAPHQRAFVAPNAVSLAEYGVTTRAWTRAIYVGEIPVGYVLLSDDDEKQRYYLWRFMIDRRYQRHGCGRRAMVMIHDYVRSRPGGNRIYLSYVPVQGGPEMFYKSLGYEDTGREHGGEREAALDL
jgi:GNAT superfamily N-acetyltransferase